MLIEPSTRHAGQCHCGAIRFAFDGPPSDASFCHCSLCRRLTGSAFGCWCAVPSANLRWLQGEDALIAYAATKRLETRFCGRCGVTVAATHLSFSGVLYIPLGTLEDREDLAPAYHQFTGSAASWYHIHGSLARYPGWPDDDASQCGWGALESSRAGQRPELRAAARGK